MTTLVTTMLSHSSKVVNFKDLFDAIFALRRPCRPVSKQDRLFYAVTWTFIINIDRNNKFVSLLSLSVPTSDNRFRLFIRRKIQCLLIATGQRTGPKKGS
jgi:hypothetical protein